MFLSLLLVAVVSLFGSSMSQASALGLIMNLSRQELINRSASQVFIFSKITAILAIFFNPGSILNRLRCRNLPRRLLTWWSRKGSLNGREGQSSSPRYVCNSYILVLYWCHAFECNLPLDSVVLPDWERVWALGVGSGWTSQGLRVVGS